MITKEMIEILMENIENEKNTYYQFWKVCLPKKSYKKLFKQEGVLIRFIGKDAIIEQGNSFAVIPITWANIDQYNLNKLDE